jgi:hypothetical protein
MDEENQASREGYSMNIFAIFENVEKYIQGRKELESEHYLALLGALNFKESHFFASGNPWNNALANLMNMPGAGSIPELANMLQLSCGNMVGLGLTYHYDSAGHQTGWDDQVGSITYHHDSAGHQTGWDQN